MGESALDNGADVEVRTYWRRRFGILVTGLTAFALLAWGLSVAFSPSQGALPGAAGQPGGAADGARGGLTGGPGGAAPGGLAGQSSSPAGPAGTSGASPAPDASSQPPGTVVVPPFCPRNDIVLSLSPDQVVFGAGQGASFSVNVVSTAPGDCSFNLGSRSLVVVVSEGAVRIWSSADCAAGNGDLVTALKRGVPTVLDISWDRRTSAPGCSGPVTRVPAGNYTAIASQGNLTSGQAAFSLG